MSRTSVLARAQAAAERRMFDACTIRRITGAVADPDTGRETPTYTVLYTGKCRIQQATAQAQREDVGEDHQLLLRLEVQLPTSVTGLQVGDQVTVTSSLDADLVGRTFRAHDLAHKTEVSARRVQCLERTGS